MKNFVLSSLLLVGAAMVYFSFNDDSLSQPIAPALLHIAEKNRPLQDTQMAEYSIGPCDCCSAGCNCVYDGTDTSIPTDTVFTVTLSGTPWDGTYTFDTYDGGYGDCIWVAHADDPPPGAPFIELFLSINGTDVTIQGNQPGLSYVGYFGSEGENWNQCTDSTWELTHYLDQYPAIEVSR